MTGYGHGLQPTPPGAAPPPVEVVWDRVARHTGGGMAVWDGTRHYIVIDPELRGARRRCVLEHERVHIQRGLPADRPGSPPSWAAVVAREEGLVEQTVAEHLVHPTDLAQLRRQAEATGAMTDAEVAEQLGVTESVARTAARRFMGAHRPSRPPQDQADDYGTC